MAIDKLISKFEKAKKSINSIKGIRSKIQAFNYTTATDALDKTKRLEYEALVKGRKDTCLYFTCLWDTAFESMRELGTRALCRSRTESRSETKLE